MSYYNPNYYNPYQQQYAAIPQVQQMPVQQVPTLNGKVVDSIEVARATEVPIGGYSVFPKADLNEIYVKSWNNNGTTSITTYKMAEASSEAPEIGFPQLIERINLLDSKLDNLISTTIPPKKTEVSF
ncbi:MAG: hypothetical protein LIO71_02935 [Ruminococcus sp.]|nr:hypothetical protein [Ruminococcus sp.]